MTPLILADTSFVCFGPNQLMGVCKNKLTSGEGASSLQRQSQVHRNAFLQTMWERSLCHFCLGWEQVSKYRKKFLCEHEAMAQLAFGHNHGNYMHNIPGKTTPEEYFWPSGSGLTVWLDHPN